MFGRDVSSAAERERGIKNKTKERDDIIHFPDEDDDDEDEDDEKEKRTVKQRHFPQSARVHLRTHADEGADESCRRREEHSSWRSLHVRRRATRTNARASTF